jgi:coproporphyrinogen III oxidase-like Fe-S oxidoreductase
LNTHGSPHSTAAPLGALERLGVDRIHPRSILVGGGTPTYLTSAQMRRFLELFNKRPELPKFDS